MKYIDSCPVCGGYIFICHEVDEPDYHTMEIIDPKKLQFYKPLIYMTKQDLKDARNNKIFWGDECVLCNTTFC